MKRFRLLYLGTPDFAVAPLEALLSSSRFEICAVVTQPDRPAGRGYELKPSPVKERALQAGLPVFAVEKIDESLLEQLKEYRADSAVVVAFGQILKKVFLESFPSGAVNLHASLLPRWRGAAPIQRALMEGDLETGIALQRVVPKLDAGPLIGVRKLVLTDAHTATEVYEQLKPLACDLLMKEYFDYLNGMLVPVSQDESKVTIAQKIQKEEGEVNWARSAQEIVNQFRGLSVWPGVWTYRNGKMLKLKKIKVAGGETQKTPGTVIDVMKDTFHVACGHSTRLEIEEVQPESRSVQRVADYLKGYPLQQGDRLGKSSNSSGSTLS